jgi:hypothetical protein
MRWFLFITVFLFLMCVIPVVFNAIREHRQWRREMRVIKTIDQRAGFVPQDRVITISRRVQL